MVENENLYDAARRACHEIGVPWTDPRSMLTYQPPVNQGDPGLLAEDIARALYNAHLLVSFETVAAMEIIQTVLRDWLISANRKGYDAAKAVNEKT